MAIRWDGSSSNYLQRTTDLIDAAAAWTAVGWARRQVDRGAVSTLCTIDNNGINQHFFGTLSNGDDLVIGLSSTPIITLTNGTWFRWAMHYNGTDTLTGRAGNLGNALSTQTSSVGDVSETHMRLGNDTFNEPWNGDICYVKMWTAELTLDEIELETMRVVPTRFANLYGWWPLISTADVRDYSGNGRDWTTAGTLADADSPPVTWAGRPLIVLAAAVAAELEQEGYRWRNDDGDEDAATWLANQDTNITRATDLNTRLRLLLNATGDPASQQFRLEYRRTGSVDWKRVARPDVA